MWFQVSLSCLNEYSIEIWRQQMTLQQQLKSMENECQCLVHFHSSIELRTTACGVVLRTFVVDLSTSIKSV